jgi:hypothetical protein
MRYFKGDYASVNDILKKVDWDTLLKTGSIDNVWDRFVDKLSIACKDNVPVYKSKPKHYDTPWMDKETLVTVQSKRKKWKKYICKTQIDVQSLIDVQSSNRRPILKYMAVFHFLNRRPMTSLTNTSNDVTPVRE